MKTLQEIRVECKAAGEYLRFHPEREGNGFLQSHYQNTNLKNQRTIKNNKLSMCCNKMLINYGTFHCVLDHLGKLFEDEDFPACGSSIDIDSAFNLEENSKWLRPKVDFFIN